MFHSLIAHKETRFLLPAFPICYIVLALLANRFSWRQLFPGPVIYLGAVALAVGSAVWARGTPVYLTSVNVADLEDAIYRDGGRSPTGDSCVLLVGHHWSFTHGQLILGRSARYLDLSAEQVNRRTVNRCEYAIVRGDAVPRFMQSGGGRWQPLRASGLSNFTLFKSR